MSYQVIARKYRPQRFIDVVGQEHVTQTLSNAIASNRIAHAYLFVGPRGTGKTTIARIFAKCLNCTDGPRVDFPADDPRAQEIAEGRSLDVLEIDGASNRGIEEIRELRETVKYAPATSRFKIYIIDEVHMLTKEAFNALLKTLEEPPAHVKFMFATTEPEKVLPTILSRCQRFDLRRIPVALIVKHLREIAQKESVQIDEAALFAIARGADGGMRDAECALDQLISFCGAQITENDVLSMFGLTAQSQLIALARAILTGDESGVLREFGVLARHGKDLGRFLGDLLRHFRNLLLYRISNGDLSLIEVTELEAGNLAEQAALVGTDALRNILEVLTEAEGRLREAASKRIFVEVSLMRAIQARNAVSIDSLLQQLNQLRGESGSGSVPSPNVAPATPRAAPTQPKPVVPMTAAPAAPPAVPPPTTPSGSEPQAESAPSTSGTPLESLWRDVVEAVGRVSPFTRSYLLEAHPVTFEKNVLVIGFDPEFADHLGLVDNAKNRALLATKLAELGHPDAQVKFVKASAPERPRPASPPAATATPAAAPVAASAAPDSSAAGAVPPASKPEVKSEKLRPVAFDPKSFKDDPLIKKALEIFKGQIVEVRA